MKLTTSLKLAAVLTSVLSVNALAADKAPGSGPNPFSDCGIGAALFPSTKWAAVTSNIIWDIGITALTSATASPETCNGKAVATAEYIYRTYDSLVEETAKGQGEYLTGMFDLVGCARQDQPAAASALRSQLAEHVTSESYERQSTVDKSSQYYDSLQATVATHCATSANS